MYLLPHQIYMDESQKKSNKCGFLKTTLQFVISVSVFYFFVWYSSGFSIIPQSFTPYFSTCLFSSMLTRTLERKYMFLIFNGIIAFLAKTSLLSLTSSPPISAAFDIEFQANNSNLSETKELVSHEEVEQVLEKQEEHHEQVSEAEAEVELELEEENEAASIAEGKDQVDEGETGRGVMMVTEDDDDELAAETTMVTNELELANTDELNRKFEEFIRKMKEEIRIEAQRHPIAV